jgi:hypothetical protein
MSSNLIVDARLTEPPSEVSVFRDVTLYAKVFLNLNILVQCKKHETDLYWYWLRRRGAFDYVTDFIEHNTELGILISLVYGDIAVHALSAETLNFVTSQLTKLVK